MHIPKSRPQRLLGALIGGLLVCLTSCTTASSAALIPTPVSVRNQHAATVRVLASGTGRSFLVGSRRIGSNSLEQALRAAVLEAGLFEEVLLTDDADWRLVISVEQLTTSDPGLSMDSSAHLRWRLMDPRRGRVRWESILVTQGSAEPEDSLDFGERGRISMERAVAANLAEGVRRLGSLVL
ncbi:MAG: hypothetical protein ACI8QC_004283 [Planctomycetota bacterium]|jgi:hypothetical protein